ncbi:MAG: hypothetical protein AAFO74_16055 [Pseudomonadota bacterium]
MMKKAIAAIMAGLLGLLLQVSSAQPALEPDDMEDNSWRVLINTFHDARLHFLYGTPNHRTTRTVAEVLESYPSYEVHLGENTYPNGNTPNLASSHCSGYTTSQLDLLLSLASDATAWAIKNGFKSNRDLFNIVPNYDRSGNILGGWVNLIVCDVSSDKVAFITKNDDRANQSNIMTFGKGYLSVHDHPIGKMVIPHELAHVYQMNFMPYFRRGLAEGNAVKTVREGLADAIGLRVVFEQFGSGGSLEAKQRSYLSRSDVKGYADKHSRRMFMIRPYNLPLQLNEGANKSLTSSQANDKAQALINAVDSVMQKRMSYFTSGFFYHIMERYLNRPGQIHGLYQRFVAAKDTENFYPKLDAFLKTKSKVKTKGPVLGLVMAQFFTEYAEWWDYRAAGKIRQLQWLKASFGGCPTVVISPGVKKRFAETDFSRFAGGCFDIFIETAIAKNHPELELFVSSEDGDPDRIYLGVARVEHAGERVYSCYERAKLRSLRGTFPCLSNPVQGETARKLPSLAGKKTRVFHLPPFNTSQRKGRQIIRVILADVPSDLSAADANSTTANAATYRLTVGIDSAVVKGRDVPDPNGRTAQGPGTRSNANRNLRESRPPRLNRTDGPLTPNGTQSVFDADARAILNGDTRLPITGVPSDADATGQLLFNLSTSTDEEDGPELGFIAKRDYFGTGEIGTFSVQAVYGFGEKIGQQDPQKPSIIEITRNDSEALVYSVELNVCAYTTRQITSHAMSGTPFDPCKDGERLTYKVENSVAFPSLLPGLVSQAGDFEAGEQSQALEDYQNVRLARLGLPSAINQNYDGDANGAGSDGSPSAGSGGSDEQSGACSIRPTGGDCDCSCAAKACFLSKQNAGLVDVAEKSCRLTCGKKWKNCTP